MLQIKLKQIAENGHVRIINLLLSPGRTSAILRLPWWWCLADASLDSLKFLLPLSFRPPLGALLSHFHVVHRLDRTFKFFVASKSVGFFIANLRSFSCDSYLLTFHLWGNGGPNWIAEFNLYQQEESSWTTARTKTSLVNGKSFADVVKQKPYLVPMLFLLAARNLLFPVLMPFLLVPGSIQVLLLPVLILLEPCFLCIRPLCGALSVSSSPFLIP